MTRQASRKGREAVYQGIGVSPGVAVGPVFRIVTEDHPAEEREISAAEVPAELARLETAVIETRRQIFAIQKQVREAIAQRDATIFDVHLMVLDDTAFIGEVIRRIESRRRNAESMVRQVAEQYAAALSVVEDDYLRERMADVKDVARRILGNLGGKAATPFEPLREKSVIVAEDLAPSETATLRRDLAAGFMTALGSTTSHTAIMARALEIPAVVGLGPAAAEFMEGDLVLVDGTTGVVVRNPGPRRLKDALRVNETRRTIETGFQALKNQPAETKDGRRVILSANLELLDQLDEVSKYGARGIGLFRSEYLYLAGHALPSEDLQFDAYDRVAERMAPDRVIIRTVDLGGDKLLHDARPGEETNPFLGLRAIRLCLARPEIFRTQLRAILRASARGNVSLMYPMVSNVEEVRAANHLLEEAKSELRQQGRPFDETLEVGVMIEIPAAALTADSLAPYVKFFSLGTNDLVQYTMAVDRGNDRVAHLYEPTHPAVLRLIRATIEAGHRHGLWVGVCGEMAGNPLMTALLLGLGIDELSMTPSAVPAVKDAVRSLTGEETVRLAEWALQMPTASEVLKGCRELTSRVAPEILTFLT